MFGNVFRNLEMQFPWLSTWLDGRLELELPAFLVSLTMHGLLLVCLAFAGYRVHQESSREFQSGVVDNLMPPSDSTFQDLDQSANPPALVAAAGSFAPTLAPTITTAPVLPGSYHAAAETAPAGGAAPELVKLDVRRATELIVPTATMLGQTVSIRGNGAEFVGGVEGAVDRIAIEILRHLEQGARWLSGHLTHPAVFLAERQRLASTLIRSTPTSTSSTRITFRTTAGC